MQSLALMFILKLIRFTDKNHRDGRKQTTLAVGISRGNVIGMPIVGTNSCPWNIVAEPVGFFSICMSLLYAYRLYIVVN